MGFVQFDGVPDTPNGFGAGSVVTIFAGAFLLFQVQPLIAKYILPWFGGGPTAWSTCMVFFQVLLLAGYGYAHLSMRCLTPRADVINGWLLRRYLG